MHPHHRSLFGRGLQLSDPVRQTLEQILDLAGSGRAGPLYCLPVPAAELLHLLARLSRARRAVEVGTSSGWSAIWIASALLANDPDEAHLFTLERDAGRIAMARRHFELSGLKSHITLVEGDALETLPTLSGPFDLAFIDADKGSYVQVFRALLPQMRRPSLVVADNVQTHAAQLKEFVREVENSGAVTAATAVPVGNGLQLAFLG